MHEEASLLASAQTAQKRKRSDGIPEPDAGADCQLEEEGSEGESAGDIS